MSFVRYLFQSRREKVTALVLWGALALIYILFNLPFVSYMNGNAGQLVQHSPFYQAPFTLNLFNFDPSLYYGYGNATVIHPLISLLSGFLTDLFGRANGNLGYLLFQSMLNAASSVLLFVYLRRGGENLLLPLVWAVWFGISSYCLFTALIPDSYPYAQFVLILSVVYLQYLRQTDKLTVLPNAVLAVLNFGITATNLIPFILSFLVQTFRKPFGAYVKKLLWLVLTAGGLLLAFSLLQAWTNDGIGWFTNWNKGLQNGGQAYVADFSFSRHWKMLYMLFISPVLTPALAFIDPKIAAFATNLNAGYPWYVSFIGFSLLALACLGFIRLIRTREGWMLAMYPLFALFLHVKIGFGLSAFRYDMYLYAGHFLFAVFLLGGRFCQKVRNPLLHKGILAAVCVFTLITLVHNAALHRDVLELVKSTYAQLPATGK